MNPLAVNATGPVTLSALGAPRTVQPIGGQAVGTPGTVGLALQDLAQGLFQRTLQVSAVYPVAETTTSSLGLAQEATASLLAALNPVQADANTTATTMAATDVTVALANNPEAAATASLDLALETALRFGAGVAAPAAPALANAGQGTGLVRDAAAIPQIRNLQPHAGGPGPEAFTRQYVPIRRVLEDYQAIQNAQNSSIPSQVDMLA